MTTTRARKRIFTTGQIRLHKTGWGTDAQPLHKPGCVHLFMNSDLVKSRLPITYCSVTHSFWNFAQSTAMILPRSVQNLKTIAQRQDKSLTNESSRDLNLGRVLYGYAILHKATVWNIVGRELRYTKTILNYWLIVNNKSAYYTIKAMQDANWSPVSHVHNVII